MNVTSTDLRAFADWLDEHPELAVAEDVRLDMGTVWLWCSTKEQLVAFKRALPAGMYKKDASEGHVMIVAELCGLKVRGAVPRREACKRVVTGIREVPEQIVPAETIPAHTEEIVEWICDPLLVGPPEEVVSA